MRVRLSTFAFALIAAATIAAPSTRVSAQGTAAPPAIFRLGTAYQPLQVDALFYETAGGRVALPADLVRAAARAGAAGAWTGSHTMADGRTVRIAITRSGTSSFGIALSADRSADITRWGLSIAAASDEYFTGLMERVVDGPQAASWAPGITRAMDLRGQKVDLLVKPTTAIYAPFYLSSRGYSVTVKGTWPGAFDFAAADPARVGIAFEGPRFELTIDTSGDPAALVRAHAMTAGPPVLPPSWTFQPWRWRDEHTQRKTYYDGTPVTGPFNSEVMEDVLMMKAFGIPNGVYWIDRPWGVGPMGYDDFEIDTARLPDFTRMVRWLNRQNQKTLLWIAPFVHGTMAADAIAKGYGLPGQTPGANGANYPLIDFTNPAARSFFQTGVTKLMNLGIAGFKLDRSEENLPADETLKVHDGRTVREIRNEYPVMFTKATVDAMRRARGNDFVAMLRAGFAGSGPIAAFWGGDIGGTQEGLRASIVAVQRSAVMGYPIWGSDTCGYNEQLMEQEVCARWLAFSAFTPIMEVGPTRNLAFWSAPRDPSYDEVLIATWRMYARLHAKLAPYTNAQAITANRTGMPIVRPLFLADPKAPSAWSNWWTYQYGPDIVVSPIWQKGQRTQRVYLPSGGRWRDAWNPTAVYPGGQTVTVTADTHQIPIFVRVGSAVALGDLNQEWTNAVAAAKTRPNLRALETQEHW